MSDKYENLNELIRGASKHFGGDDPDSDEGADPWLRSACDDIVQMFDDADGSRAVFVEKLKSVAGYISWKPKA